MYVFFFNYIGFTYIMDFNKNLSKTSFLSTNSIDNYSNGANEIKPEKEDNSTHVDYLVINSRSRDVAKYPLPNNYSVDLGKEYKNIHSMELIQAIVPDKNSVTSEPYLLLSIQEIRNVMHSPDSQVADSFAFLQMAPPTTTGGFIQIDKRVHEHVKIIFDTPKSSLSRISIKITDSEGNLFDFGGSGSLVKDYQNTFVFKIVTLVRNRQALNTQTVY